VLVQLPNLPLCAWIGFRAASLLLSSGRAHAGLAFLAAASLFTWAYLELAHGVNGFRRTVGGVVLASVVLGHFL
jgi:hypothetical protein